LLPVGFIGWWYFQFYLSGIFQIASEITSLFLVNNDFIIPVPLNSTDSFVFGNPGDLPLTGRWDNQIYKDGIGVHRSTNGLVYLRRSLSTGVSDYSMVVGNPGDMALAADWDGNGYDTVNVYRASTRIPYLSDAITDNGSPEFYAAYLPTGVPACYPLIGDWLSKGVSGPGCQIGDTVYARAYSTQIADTQNTAIVYPNPIGTPIAGRWSNTAIATQDNGGGDSVQKRETPTPTPTYKYPYGIIVYATPPPGYANPPVGGGD